jgi:hypothetical protein
MWTKIVGFSQKKNYLSPEKSKRKQALLVSNLSEIGFYYTVKKECFGTPFSLSPHY